MLVQRVLYSSKRTELQQAVTELALDISGNWSSPLDESTPLDGITF